MNDTKGCPWTMDMHKIGKKQFITTIASAGPYRETRKLVSLSKELSGSWLLIMYLSSQSIFLQIRDGNTVQGHIPMHFRCVICMLYNIWQGRRKQQAFLLIWHFSSLWESNIYNTVSDVIEVEVQFASKILTPHCTKISTTSDTMSYV